jgi:Ca-activated chloride channel family protein
MTPIRKRHVPVSIAILLFLLQITPRWPVHAQDQPPPTFKSGVAVVPITALVRDSRNRIVRNLARDDFRVLEQGQPRPIVDFRSKTDAPISVAFLFDTSGSMSVASNLDKGKQFVQHFLNQMDPASDEAALFTFHRSLREEVPFTNERSRIDRALDGVGPWGLTSLYDAVAETAKQLGNRPAPRRAVVVISDGVDTSSALSSPEVAALASAIDVPVYVIAVVSPLDSPSRTSGGSAERTRGALSDLAYWTGGDLLEVTGSEQAGLATKELLTVLRQQYFLAIESSPTPGWYQLEVKTRRPGLTVRARSAYFAGDITHIGQPPR